MSLDVLAVHVLLALVLFFVANWLGKYSVSSGYHALTLFENTDEAPAFNFTFRVVTPLVFIAVVAAVLYGVGLDHWVQQFYLVVLYYFGLRWLYALIVGRGRLLNWTRQLVTALVTGAAAYLLYIHVLAHRGTLLPDAASLNSNLWVLIIIYLYTVANRIPLANAGALARRKSYIFHRYHTLHAAFSLDVSATAQNSSEEALVYAVMIYETFNRPFVYRAIERWVFWPIGLAKSIGPMQVQVTAPVSDHASVTLATKQLIGLYRASLPRLQKEVVSWDIAESSRGRYAQSAAVRAAAREYNVRGDYADEVESIFDLLVENFYPEAKPAQSPTA